MSRGEAGEGAQGVLDIEIPDEVYEPETMLIPHELIEPDPDQPRTDADDELRASIAQGGVRQDITVRPKPGAIGIWLIVDGERRWRGAKGVQAQMRCKIRRGLDDRTLRLREQVVMNKGKELTPLQQARAYHEMYRERGGTIADFAAFVGEKVSTVSQRLSLMELGPWLPLLEAGAISYTYAVEVLFPYRGCPDAVHAAVIEKVSPRLALPATDPLAIESREEFEHIVADAYKPFLYPIAKHKYDALPRFNPKDHGAECACGGIELTSHAGKRKHCGNPDWWKPLDAAAKKAEKAKAKASGGNKPAVAERTKPFYAPVGTKVLEGAAHETPKGYTPLVDSAGAYATAFSHGSSARQNFDPKDVVVKDADLAVRGSTLYVKESAIKPAREAWAKRWEARYVALLEAFRKQLAKKANLTVRRDSAADVLAVLVAAARRDELLHDVLACLDLVNEAYERATADARQYYNGPVDVRALLAWARKLDAAKAAAAVEYYVTATAAQLDAPSEALAKEQEQAIAEIRKRKHPWAKPPKARGPKDTADDDTLDEDDAE